MTKTELDLVVVIGVPLLLACIVRIGISREDRNYRNKGGNPAVVPNGVRVGCTWVPAVLLGLLLLWGMTGK